MTENSGGGHDGMQAENGASEDRSGRRGERRREGKKEIEDRRGEGIVADAV